jgi:hypothetical protein
MPATTHNPDQSSTADIAQLLGAILERLTDLSNRLEPSQPSYTRATAAAYLGISEAFLKRLDLDGRGPRAIRINRRWTYLQSDLDAFREQLRAAA